MWPILPDGSSLNALVKYQEQIRGDAGRNVSEAPTWDHISMRDILGLAGIITK